MFNLLIKLFNFIKKLLGLDKKPSSDLEWLQEKTKKADEKLKEIENEKPSIDDINDHFNK